MLPDYATIKNEKVFLPSSFKPPLSLMNPSSKLIKDGKLEPLYVCRLIKICSVVQPLGVDSYYGMGILTSSCLIVKLICVCVLLS